VERGAADFLLEMFAPLRCQSIDAFLFFGGNIRSEEYGITNK
jgi:hypothetical protein